MLSDLTTTRKMIYTLIGYVRCITSFYIPVFSFGNGDFLIQSSFLIDIPDFETVIE